MSRLYVWARNDLDSLTPGKLAAQVAHAASQAAFQMAGVSAEYKNWEFSADKEMSRQTRFERHAFCGFGTTIVLAADSGTELETVYDRLLDSDIQYYRYGMVVDPSYPISDGRVTHFLEMLTCVWVFDDGLESSEKVREITQKYSLY